MEFEDLLPDWHGSDDNALDQEERWRKLEKWALRLRITIMDLLDDQLTLLLDDLQEAEIRVHRQKERFSKGKYPPPPPPGVPEGSAKDAFPEKREGQRKLFEMLTELIEASHSHVEKQDGATTSGAGESSDDESLAWAVLRHWDQVLKIPESSPVYKKAYMDEDEEALAFSRLSHWMAEAASFADELLAAVTTLCFHPDMIEAAIGARTVTISDNDGQQEEKDDGHAGDAGDEQGGDCVVVETVSSSGESVGAELNPDGNHGDGSVSEELKNSHEDDGSNGANAGTNSGGDHADGSVSEEQKNCDHADGARGATVELKSEAELANEPVEPESQIENQETEKKSPHSERDSDHEEERDEEERWSRLEKWEFRQRTTIQKILLDQVSLLLDDFQEAKVRVDCHKERFSGGKGPVAPAAVSKERAGGATGVRGQEALREKRMRQQKLFQMFKEFVEASSSRLGKQDGATTSGAGDDSSDDDALPVYASAMRRRWAHCLKIPESSPVYGKVGLVEDDEAPVFSRLSNWMGDAASFSDELLAAVTKLSCQTDRLEATLGSLKVNVGDDPKEEEDGQPGNGAEEQGNEGDRVETIAVSGKSAGEERKCSDGDRKEGSASLDQNA